MDSGGGYLLPREGDQSAHAGPLVHDEDQEQHSHASLPRSLTDRQQTRLTAYLDDAFHKLNRGFLRRHEPYSAAPSQEKESWHPTMGSAIAAWIPVLGLIVRIPPVGASAPLIVSQLLRATSELTEQIVGYSLGEPVSEIVQQAPKSALLHSLTGSDVDAQLHAVLALLDILDTIWSELIKGYAVAQYQQRLEDLVSAGPGSNADRSWPHPDALQTDPSGRFHQGRHSLSSDGIGARPAADFHPFPPSTPANPHEQSVARQAQRLPGSPLSQTERIRLRNVSLLARDRLFRWMREVLDAPPPPEVEEDGLDTGDSSTDREGRRDGTGVRGHGSRVAALLQYDLRARTSPARKKRRVQTDDDDQRLLQEEREFAELAGEQGDLDAGMSPLRDEAVDEDDDPEEESPLKSGQPDRAEEQPQETGLPDMEDVDVANVDEQRETADADRNLDAEHDRGDTQDEERAELKREHDHYESLFSRKLDPDASDEEGDDARNEATPSSAAAPPSDNDDEGTKSRRRRRRERSGSIDSADAHTLKSAALPPSHSIVGQWDLEFSRCFRRTLRLLAETAEKGQNDT